MKRLFLAICSILISQVLPLCFKPELIIDKKNIVLMIVNAAVWLTQPPVSGSETVKNKGTDKFSVLLILFFSLGSIALSVCDWAYIGNTITSKYISLVGVCLMILGIIIRTWAIQVLGKYFTATVQIKDDHKLITKGPYTYVRHPSNAGAWITITGATVFFGSYIAFVVALLGMGFSYYIRIKLEEKILVQVFGQEYRNYQKRVRKIIPFIW
jgi:protein-S-isoprenylcysteine O-methyltransferase Ste14